MEQKVFWGPCEGRGGAQFVRKSINVGARGKCWVVILHQTESERADESESDGDLTSQPLSLSCLLLQPLLNSPLLMIDEPSYHSRQNTYCPRMCTRTSQSHRRAVNVIFYSQTISLFHLCCSVCWYADRHSTTTQLVWDKQLHSLSLLLRPLRWSRRYGFVQRWRGMNR